MAEDRGASSPRWIPLVSIALAACGTTGLVGGGLITISAWRAGVDSSIADLKKRMVDVETNDRTYTPVLIGLSKDVTYLADRARREDDRRDRDQVRR